MPKAALPKPPNPAVGEPKTGFSPKPEVCPKVGDAVAPPNMETPDPIAGAPPKTDPPVDPAKLEAPKMPAAGC